MSKYLYFSVEGGRTLELAVAHCKARQEQHDRNAALVSELGADQWVESFMDGTVSGVVFKEGSHPKFKKPNRRGISFPRKGTEWAARFDAQGPGIDARYYALAEALAVPTVIRYEGPEVSGSAVLGRFSSPVGFLYPDTNGPYGLYCLDISDRVAYYTGRGYTVDEHCANFKPEFDGARPILQEEWDLIVARWKLEQARS